MFKLHWPRELTDFSNNASDALREGQADILDVVGVQLMSDIQLNYIDKSRRGSGVDGKRWKELSPHTERLKSRKAKGAKARQKQRDLGNRSQIGVDTGMQLASAEPGFKASDGKGGNILIATDSFVEVGFGREYSEDFDEDRPLIPDPLPVEWLETIETIVVEESQILLEKELDR